MRNRLTFRLRSMFVVVTLVAVWLGLQVNSLRQRQQARRWIEQHEDSGGWSRIDPRDVMVFASDGKRYPDKANDPPWMLTLMGEKPLTYIHLDKSKLREADIPRIDALQALFPEAAGVHVKEPGWTTCWPPPDPHAFLKYPSRLIGGKLVNQPVDAGAKAN